MTGTPNKKASRKVLGRNLYVYPLRPRNHVRILILPHSSAVRAFWEGTGIRGML